MLTINPAKRITADQALKHPWVCVSVFLCYRLISGLPWTDTSRRFSCGGTQNILSISNCDYFFSFLGGWPYTSQLCHAVVLYCHCRKKKKSLILLEVLWMSVISGFPHVFCSNPYHPKVSDGAWHQMKYFRIILFFISTSVYRIASLQCWNISAVLQLNCL